MIKFMNLKLHHKFNIITSFLSLFPSTEVDGQGDFFVERLLVCY